MKADILATRIRKLVRDHHDAFRIELLGGQAGVSPERIQELMATGVITTEQLDGFSVPGLDHDIDYYEYVHMVSRIFDDTDPEKRHELRRWSTDTWNTAIDKKFGEVWNQPAPAQEGGFVDFERPGVSSTAKTEPEAPTWLAPNEVRAYQAAVERAGSYARGLGDTLADAMGNHVLEVWDGEDIVLEADAELRQERVRQIREATAEAVAQHDDPERLALELMRKTDDWEHNWERIARTEIQGAYNEGRVMSAIENYGTDAQIAKVTESGACDYCLSLYRNDAGEPVVFTVEELLANGTNVGRTKRAWRATIWPTHPNCRCDTVVVPPGLVVNEYGGLRRPEM